MKNGRLSKKAVRSGIFQVFCLVLGLLIISPLIYSVLMSFMSENEIVSSELHILPSKWDLSNYIYVITKTNIFRFMWNSLVVALVSSIGRIVTACFAAYSFTFFEFKGKKILFAMVVATMIIPPEMLMVQNYFTVAEMKLINSYPGMVAIYLVSAANIFLVRNHFKSYPVSIREAAVMDGCGSLWFFFRILLPMSMPVMATVFITSFVTSWNSYLWPLMVTNMNEMRTVQVLVPMLNASEISSSYGLVMAASTLILIPSILIFILFQQKITSGMMAGATKG